MINAKQRRIQKSQARNPLYTGNKDQVQNKNVNKMHSIGETKALARNEELENEKRSFSGVKSKPGETKIRSKFSLKNQSILHNKIIKKEKKAAKHDHSRKTKLERAKRELKVMIRLCICIFLFYCDEVFSFFFFFFRSSKLPKGLTRRMQTSINS